MKKITLFLLLSCALVAASAEDWPQWRGPNFNGSTSEKNLPDKFAPDTAKWTLDLPGPGAATPVIVGNKVFLSTTDAQAQSLHALCIDASSGKILWNNKTGDGIRRDDRSNFAAPSPVADKDRVFFFYSNGALAAFDHSGKELWTRNIVKEFGEFAFQWTFSSTPLLANGKLYLQVLQRDVPVRGRARAEGKIESFILALDPATGKTLWRQVRPSEAVAESLESYSTPLPFEHNGRKEIVIAGGDCLTGHDPESGRELWRWGTWNPNKIPHWRLVPSPVAGGGLILACAPKKDPIYAIKAGGNGLLDDSAIAWKSDQVREISSDVPTPLFYQNDFFVLSDVRECISRVEPATGKVKWTRDLPGNKKFEASPTGADGKIYIMNFAGDVVVVDAAKGEILSTNKMGEDQDDLIRSTISVANGKLFIRTNKKLFAVGK